MLKMLTRHRVKKKLKIFNNEKNVNKKVGYILNREFSANFWIVENELPVHNRN